MDNVAKALALDCPACGSKAGHACRTDRGTAIMSVHRDRVTRVLLSRLDDLERVWFVTGQSELNKRMRIPW
jgi:hypothetical protein